MRNTLVYDWPTRVFHWMFALLFIGAFFIAKVLDDDSALYPYHMIMGLTMAALVVFRIFWGLFGTRYAKFNSFMLSPVSVVEYFKDLLTSKTSKVLSHNPASSWAAIIMMLLTLGLALTGYLMTTGSRQDVIKEVHELLANAFVIVVIAHIAGIIFHTIRHKDMIGLSMVDGQKVSVPGSLGVEKSYPALGLVVFVLVLAFLGNLVRNYDSNQKTLKVFGATLQVGENENENEGGRRDNDGDNDED